MSLEMTEKVNAVSHSLGLAELDKQDEGDSFDRIDNPFVISRQAVQDKVLSPIIEELDIAIRSGNEENAGHCFNLHSQEFQLKKALVSLRTLIVDEKDAICRLKEQTKRRRDVA